MQAVPAFLTIIIMPLATSITEGLAFGFIATSLLSLMAGKPRRFGAGVHVIGALFLLRYVFLR
jgi:AGZA family xanthine/uracil permease-like MFS transporter